MHGIQIICVIISTWSFRLLIIGHSVSAPCSSLTDQTLALAVTVMFYWLF